MAAYLVVDTDLTNPEAYEEYKLKARPIAEKYGGEYLARGGKMKLKETQLWSPKRLVLVKFPSFEQAEKFYESAEYQAVLPIRKKSAHSTVVILEGI